MGEINISLSKADAYFSVLPMYGAKDKAGMRRSPFCETRFEWTLWSVGALIYDT